MWGAVAFEFKWRAPLYMCQHVSVVFYSDYSQMSLLLLLGMAVVAVSGVSILRASTDRSMDNLVTRESLNVSGSILTLGAYYVPVMVANQTFLVQLDTGSSLFAVPAVANYSSAPYNPAASATYEAMSCTAAGCLQCGTYLSTQQCSFGEAFGGGDNISGVLATDMVELGGITGRASVAMILQEQGPFEPPPIEGILGLAQPSLACNPTCVPPLLVSLNVSSLFGLCLCASAPGGEFDLGGIVISRARNATVFYTPLVPHSGYYRITLLDLLGDSSSLVGSLQSPLFQSLVVIVDSGTTLLLFPTWIYDNFISYLQSLNLTGVDSLTTGHCVCLNATDIAQYPTLWFRFPDATNPYQMIQVPVGPQEYLLTIDGVVCLAVATSDGNLTVLGDVFMQSIYTVFDVQNGRVGFGSLANAVCGSCQAANPFLSSCSGGTLELVTGDQYVGVIGNGNTTTLPPIVAWPVSTDQDPLQVPGNGSFTLNFTLPEAAVPGTVEVIFSNLSSVTYGYAFTLKLPWANVSQSYQIFAANVSAFGLNEPIPPGIYMVQVSYRNVYTNLVAKSTPFWINVLYPSPMPWHLSSPAPFSVQNGSFLVACTTCFDAPALNSAVVSVVLVPIDSNSNQTSIDLTYYPIITNSNALSFTLDPRLLSVTYQALSFSFPQLAAVVPPGLTSIPDGGWSISVAVPTETGLQVSEPVSFFIQTGSLPLTILQPSPNTEIKGGVIQVVWTIPYSLNGSSNPYASISNASGTLATIGFPADMNGTLEMSVDMLSIINTTCPFLSPCIFNTTGYLAPGAYNFSITYFAPRSWTNASSWTRTISNVTWYLYPTDCPNGTCTPAPTPVPEAPLDTSAQCNGPAAWNALPYWAWILILVGGTLIITVILTLLIVMCVSKGPPYSLMGSAV